MLTNEDFIQTIKRLKAEGAALQDIAKRLKISPQYLSNLMKGRQAVPDPILNRFQEIYEAGITIVAESEVEYKVKNAGYDDNVMMQGEDMAPEIHGGDKLFLKRIDHHHTLPWGHTFLVYTNNFHIVRHLLPGRDEEEVTLHSCNPNYPDIHIKREEITALHLVVSRIDRKFI